jgi:hypothetical protein
MRRTLTALASMLAMTAFAATAIAGGPILNLKGTWVGTSESIERGTALHHAPETDTKPHLDNVEFTLTISGQDGRRFWGTISSKRNHEPVTGVIAYDGRTVVAQDSDGLIQGTIIDVDTIDTVYSHTGKSTVVAVNRMKRQK